MVKGPTSMPTGPKRAIPPKTENRIIRGGRFILLPIITGFNKLSIITTITTAQSRRPKASSDFPVAKRNITAGTETNPLPIIGIREVIIANNPQRAGFGMPNMANPTLTSAP